MSLRRVVEIIRSLLGLAPRPEPLCDRESGVWLLPPAPPRPLPQRERLAEAGRGGDGWELEAPVDVLRATLSSPSTPERSRSVALTELVERGDSFLAGYIANTLASETTNTEWARELVLAADTLRHVDDETRRVLVAAIKKQALLLRTAPEAAAGPSLWAALRTFARHVRSVDEDFFGAFLDSDSSLTRQAALQALQTVFGRDEAERRAESITARLYELCEKYLDPDFLTNGANRALAANAYAAAVLVAPASARVAALTDRVLAVGGETLPKIAALALRDARAPVREDVERIVGRLEAVG